MKYTYLAAVVVLLSVVLPLRAEVIDAEKNGFTVRHEFSIAAARDDVYRAATERVGDWWSDAHTMSGDASNMSIESKAPGCFCERLGEHGSIVHMTVTFINPGVIVRLTGGLGPLGLMGVDGNMTWEFNDDGDRTRVTLNYAVGGYFAGGLDTLATAVDGVLLEQMMRLKNFVESATGES
jgi:hypothetical protein